MGLIVVLVSLIVATILLKADNVLCAIDDTDIGNSYWHDEPRRDSQEIKYGWRLVILPSPGNVANTLVKRIDETLNLTCTAEYFHDGVTNVTSDLHQDQIFKLTWHLPIMPQNSQPRWSFVDSHNSKQLIVTHLKESDAGEYECQSKAESDSDYAVAFTESVTIRVKPKKGGCGDPSFLCSSGECIAKRFLCDGMVDCKDKSDEGFETCGTYHPCESKLKCDDGRCISPLWCCDRSIEKNCSVWVIPPCCRQLKHLQLDITQYSSQPHHYNEMGFLQTTIYTVIGCAMAFMFIITILVITICRLHLKRTAMAHPQMRANATQSPFGEILFNSSGGVPYTSAASGLLVTYNINNGVQFMGRPLNPPPYSELVRIPPREGPPPPYTSNENLARIDASPSTSPNPNPNQSPSVITSDCQIRIRRDISSPTSRNANAADGVAQPLLQGEQQQGAASSSEPRTNSPSVQQQTENSATPSTTTVIDESSSL